MSKEKPAGDEPKQGTTRKNTKNGGLTPKEAKLAQALITTTDNISEAGRIAGYCDAQEAHRAYQRVQRKMPDLLDAHGLTEDHVIEECLKPSLKAMETKFFADKGIVMTQKDVIAWGPRQQAEERYWRLRGRLNPKVQLDVSHRHHLDLSGATDDDLRAIVRIANRSRSGNSRGDGRVLQATPTSVDAGG